MAKRSENIKRNENILNGMDEIATYLNRSHDTVLNTYQRKMGLPITKVGDNGIWVGNKKEIDKWIAEVLTKTQQQKRR